ncbi:TPA: hypothetical protein ACVU5C_005013 [Vibrio parahaemolyticus]|nr:hypothetical protein [Vibrio parahaemolyticus]HBC3521444.1 hypothetical protein [Vibrio parahaemolyticus]
MKKEMFILPFLLFSGLSFASNKYIVHESEQGTSFLFEKATKSSQDTVKYRLKKIENGYKFVAIEGDESTGGNITDPSESSFYDLGSIQGFEKAKQGCTSLNVEGKKWKIVDEAILDNLASQGVNVDSNVFNIFAGAGYAIWMESDTIWEYSTTGNPADNVMVNAAMLNTSSGDVKHQNITFGDVFINNTICMTY